MEQDRNEGETVLSEALWSGDQVQDDLSYIPSFLEKGNEEDFGLRVLQGSTLLFFFFGSVINLSRLHTTLFLQSWIFLDLMGAQTGQLVRGFCSCTAFHKKYASG